MQVEVVRRGGIAGVTLRGVVDTAELTAAEAKTAEAALRALPFGRPPAAPRHPDSFQYEIAIVRDGVRRSIVLDEGQVPEELRPVIDAAVARGHLD
jgi:hypothetical protein